MVFPTHVIKLVAQDKKKKKYMTVDTLVIIHKQCLLSMLHYLVLMNNT